MTKKEALIFYSNTVNYAGGYYESISENAEDVAREALKSIESNKEERE